MAWDSREDGTSRSVPGTWGLSIQWTREPAPRPTSSSISRGTETVPIFWIVYGPCGVSKPGSTLVIITLITLRPMTRLVSGFRQWMRRRHRGYGSGVSATANEHLRLEEAFTQCAGQWIAVDRRTGHVVAARPSPYELSAHLKANRVRGVDVMRAPDLNEPEVVGIG